jgi:uncharacterized protein
MAEMWLSLSEIPAHGREFSFTDQSMWTDPLEEFGYTYEILSPFEARLTVLPQKKGYLIEGWFGGSVRLPCDRCSEPGTVDMDERFQVYEEPAGEENEEQTFLRPSGKTFELNVPGCSGSSSSWPFRPSWSAPRDVGASVRTAVRT